MDNINDAELKKKQWLAALKDSESEYRRAAHKRNVAAIADFTKNLLSLVAGAGGLRYNVAGKPVAGAANKAYEEARQRYRNALIDYEGRVASLKLMPQEKKPQAATSVTYNFLQGNRHSLVPSFNLHKQSTPRWLSNYTATAPWQKNIQFNIKNLKTPYWYSNNK